MKMFGRRRGNGSEGTVTGRYMIKAGIIGATGYAGGELARLLLQREDVEVVWYGSRSYVDKKYASIYQNMFRLVEAFFLST